jgi:hypothetical protein
MHGQNRQWQGYTKTKHKNKAAFISVCSLNNVNVEKTTKKKTDIPFV